MIEMTYGGHRIQGDVSFTRNSDGTIELKLDDGRFMCGPHDESGNHVEQEDTK